MHNAVMTHHEVDYGDCVEVYTYTHEDFKNVAAVMSRRKMKLVRHFAPMNRKVFGLNIGRTTKLIFKRI